MEQETEMAIVLLFTIEERDFEIILRGDEANNASEIAERIRDNHNLTVEMKAIAVVQPINMVSDIFLKKISLDLVCYWLLGNMSGIKQQDAGQ